MIEVDKHEDKEAQYRILIKHAEALIQDESDDLANTCNILSLIHYSLGLHWTGIYRVEGAELVLGPFQGPPACTRIAYGKGVCGTSWKQEESLIVPDVHAFPGHIACSAETNSEIVVPVRNQDGSVQGVLDLDSASFHAFDEIDRVNLEKLATYLKF
jgi:L-methionine (R)-S-oxide reductase